MEGRIIDQGSAFSIGSGVQIGGIMFSMGSFEKKIKEPPLAYPGAPLESERAKQPPLPAFLYQLDDEAAVPEAPYQPYAKKPGTAEVPYKPYQKPAVPDAPYKPYAKKPGAAVPYKPYKGM